ncbi:MAG: hypothetical protein AAF654_12350 [Myxococcota bacterium]
MRTEIGYLSRGNWSIRPVCTTPTLSGVDGSEAATTSVGDFSLLSRLHALEEAEHDA